MSTHHMLEIKPVPEQVLYINEPWLVDASFDCLEKWLPEPDDQPDNVRIYAPIDLNAEAILRKLRNIIRRYGEANEANESDYGAEVRRLVSQIEIYDQVWFVREGPFDSDKDGRIGVHSVKAVELVRQFPALLERIPDGCAELFPDDLIEELKEEYLQDPRHCGGRV